MHLALDAFESFPAVGDWQSAHGNARCIRDAGSTVWRVLAASIMPVPDCARLPRQRPLHGRRKARLIDLALCPRDRRCRRCSQDRKRDAFGRLPAPMGTRFSAYRPAPAVSTLSLLQPHQRVRGGFPIGDLFALRSCRKWSRGIVPLPHGQLRRDPGADAPRRAPPRPPPRRRPGARRPHGRR